VESFPFATGGLRCAATTGYYLSALQAEILASRARVLNCIRRYRVVVLTSWDRNYRNLTVGLKLHQYRALGKEKSGYSTLTTDEAREVMNIARRIATILLLEPGRPRSLCSR
jgi:hypothetical protein